MVTSALKRCRRPKQRNAQTTKPSVADDDLENLESTVNQGLHLSYTDTGLLHIARALVMNPEVLVIHKPLSHFDDIHSRAVLDYLREFVDQRGVEKPEEGRITRRPRTCMYSADTTGATHVADVTLYVGAGKVQEVDMEELKELRVYARHLFEQMDVNKDQQIGYDEFRAAILRAPVAAEMLGIEGGEDVEVSMKRVFTQVDVSGNGEVDFEELVDFLRTRFEDNLPEVLHTFRKVHGHEQGVKHVKGPSIVATSCLDADVWTGPEVPQEMRFPGANVSAGSVPHSAASVPPYEMLSR